MKSISINIKKLGKLRDAGSIKLNNLMIFSGESGLGKSYVAILCHYFFDILLDRSRISRFFEEQGFDYDQMWPTFKNEGIALSFKKETFEQWLAVDAVKYVGYMINNERLEGKIEVSLPDNIDSTISIAYSEEMTGLVNNEDASIRLTLASLSTRMKDNAFHEESPFAFLFRFYLIQSLFGQHTALKESFVFPPSRGPLLTEEVKPITGIYSKFKDCLYQLKRPLRDGEEINSETLTLFEHILNGKVSYRDNDYVYVTDNIELPISAAAASIRELAPIEQMVRKVDLSKTAILIEEPEAHLHPLKQRMMADITSSLMRAGAIMQITTHSDYYLRRINELMLFNKLVGKSNVKEIVASLGIPSALAIDPTKVSAYLLQRRKEDDSTEIIEQDLNSGIPFASFHDALKESLSTLVKLNEFLDTSDERD